MNWTVSKLVFTFERLKHDKWRQSSTYYDTNKMLWGQHKLVYLDAVWMSQMIDLYFIMSSPYLLLAISSIFLCSWFNYMAKGSLKTGYAFS